MKFQSQGLSDCEITVFYHKYFTKCSLIKVFFRPFGANPQCWLTDRRYPTNDKWRSDAICVKKRIIVLRAFVMCLFLSNVAQLAISCSSHSFAGCKVKSRKIDRTPSGCLERKFKLWHGWSQWIVSKYADWMARQQTSYCIRMITLHVLAVVKCQKLTLYPKWSLPVTDEVSCVIFACQMIYTMCEVFTVQYSQIFNCIINSIYSLAREIQRDDIHGLVRIINFIV